MIIHPIRTLPHLWLCKKDMIISIIVAVASDNAIGKGNNLLWHLSEDLKRFKSITKGHSIIMGRNTFYSLPNGALPLRRNIVVSRTISSIEGVECYDSLSAALDAARGEEEVFVIGGGQLYAATLPLADRLYFTRVEQSFPDADTFFPDFDLTEWTPSYSLHSLQSEQNEYASTFTIYQRIPYFKDKNK